MATRIHPRNIVLLVGVFLCCCRPDKSLSVVTQRTYYLDTRGDDTNSGSKGEPWKSIHMLNGIDLNPGDSIVFQRGLSFEGTLTLDSVDTGTFDLPIVITSMPGAMATIDAMDGEALVLNATHDIVVSRLHLKGSGRKNGNAGNGLTIQHNSSQILIDSVEIEGFQKSGLSVFCSSHIVADKIHAHDNGAGGITVAGATTKSDTHHITIRNSLAENNPGDPTALTNHSGSGILAGLCSRVTIEQCVATNNGWDMPRTGNGPVGIWTYESDSVVIQNCISYRNKTSKGGDDGGGFDLDGGVTNAVVQYCLSFENEGSGFGIFQYAGASAWRNNTIRFCISENDGLVSRAHSGVFIWNGGENQDLFADMRFYNNVIYNAHGTAIHFDQYSDRRNFQFYNNIFVSANALTEGDMKDDIFAGNNWWSLKHKFKLDGFTSFAMWTAKTGHEQIENKTRGMNIDPGKGTVQSDAITSPAQLKRFIRYKVMPGSPLMTMGVDLEKTKGIDRGPLDFNQNPLIENGIGASF